MPDQDLKVQQEEVNRLMGRCVLRLQQYETQLKAILAHHDVSATLQDFDAVPVARPVAASQRTLGTLVKAFVGSVLVSGEPVAEEGEEEEADDGPPRFRLRLRLGLAEEDFARTETELRELVRLRNDLIHHFMERHDLWTVEGCRIAQAELAASSDLIGAHVVRLREWAADLDRTLQELSEAVRSEAFRVAVVDGIQPDGMVFWPGAGIVFALREAAQALAVEGWTEVSAAVRWIAERYPDQTPGRYGCSTFPQVLHESREFDLCRLPKDGSPRRHYRLRDAAKQKGGGQIAHPTVFPGRGG